MVTKPGPFLGIGTASHFELQTAYPAAKAITTASQSQLVGGFTHSPEFQMNAKGTAVQMRVAMNAPTTSSGAKFPRTEFREMATNGTTEMAFDPSRGYHMLWVTEAATHLPPVKPSVIGCQIHTATDDMIEMGWQPRSDYASSGKVEFVFRVNGTSSGLPRLSTDYALGTKKTFGMAFDQGDWAIYNEDLLVPFYTSDAPGAPVITFTRKKDCYFKAGCYAQSNATIDKASEYASIDLYAVSAYHSV
jgi:hypothetical protein